MGSSASAPAAAHLQCAAVFRRALKVRPLSDRGLERSQLPCAPRMWPRILVGKCAECRDSQSEGGEEAECCDTHTPRQATRPNAAMHTPTSHRPGTLPKAPRFASNAAAFWARAAKPDPQATSMVCTSSLPEHRQVPTRKQEASTAKLFKILTIPSGPIRLWLRWSSCTATLLTKQASADAPSLPMWLLSNFNDCTGCPISRKKLLRALQPASPMLFQDASTSSIRAPFVRRFLLAHPHHSLVQRSSRPRCCKRISNMPCINCPGCVCVCYMFNHGTLGSLRI